MYGPLNDVMNKLPVNDILYYIILYYIIILYYYITIYIVYTLLQIETIECMKHQTEFKGNDHLPRQNIF